MKHFTVPVLSQCCHLRVYQLWHIYMGTVPSEPLKSTISPSPVISRLPARDEISWEGLVFPGQGMRSPLDVPGLINSVFAILLTRRTKPVLGWDMIPADNLIAFRWFCSTVPAVWSVKIYMCNQTIPPPPTPILGRKGGGGGESYLIAVERCCGVQSRTCTRNELADTHCEFPV